MAFGKKKESGARAKKSLSKPKHSKPVSSKKPPPKKSKGGICGCKKKKDKGAQSSRHPPGSKPKTPAPYASWVPLDDGKKPTGPPDKTKSKSDSKRQKPTTKVPSKPSTTNVSAKRQPGPAPAPGPAKEDASKRPQQPTPAVASASQSTAFTDTKEPKSSTEKSKRGREVTKTKRAGDRKGVFQELTVRYYEDGDPPRAHRQYKYTSSWPLGEEPPLLDKRLTRSASNTRSASRRDLSTGGRGGCNAIKCTNKSSAQIKVLTSDSSSATNSDHEQRDRELAPVGRISSETAVECGPGDREKLESARKALCSARTSINNLQMLAGKRQFPDLGSLKCKTDFLLKDIDDLVGRLNGLSRK